jgi:hypothetical protein
MRDGRFLESTPISANCTLFSKIRGFLDIARRSRLCLRSVCRKGYVYAAERPRGDGKVFSEPAELGESMLLGQIGVLCDRRSSVVAAIGE